MSEAGEVLEEDEGDEKVRSVSHTDTSTSLPASAKEVEEGPPDESAISGDGTDRSCMGVEDDEVA